MKRLVLLVSLLGLSAAANASLSPIIHSAISANLGNLLSLISLLTTAGVAIWVASTVLNRFLPEAPTAGSASDRWNTFTDTDHPGKVFKVRRKNDGSRGFDAVNDPGVGQTYTYRD